MIVDQIKKNLLAVISLFVAFSALGYNTWRNEQTEHNRNIRTAGFEMLLHIGELQRITYLAHYDKDQVAGNPRKGWTEVLVLQDLSELIPKSRQLRSEQLFKVWSNHWQGLGSDDQSVAAIDNAINDLRKDTLNVLRLLD